MNIFRKGGEKLKQVKMKGKEEKEEENIEKGIVYQISCKECEEFCIGETKITIEKMK